MLKCELVIWPPASIDKFDFTFLLDHWSGLFSSFRLIILEAEMALPELTLRSLKARPLLLPLKRPVVARMATIESWPLILIDLETEEGFVGRAYLEPYVPKSMNYLVPALHDMGEMLKASE